MIMGLENHNNTYIILRSSDVFEANCVTCRVGIIWKVHRCGGCFKIIKYN